METSKVGIIGVGNIFPQYVQNLRRYPFLEVVACADMRMDQARARGAEYNLQSLTVNELLVHPEIEVVVNLTVPRAHAEVSLQIIQAGKHVYSEKPLATNISDARSVLQAAKAAGVRVGCAPDTFLGGGLQTCRKLIADGWIGTPIGATACFANHGMEHWHPNPAFFYQEGAGPVFDMGPYYLTALFQLMGAIKQVTAITGISFAERTITSEPLLGQKIPVNVPTFNAGIIEFTSGAIASILMSFDIWQHSLPFIEIYGSQGTLRIPDPNTFGGPVTVWLQTEAEWQQIPLLFTDEVGRGVGVADMVYCIRRGIAHRAQGGIAYHILEVMQSFQQSFDTRAFVQVESQPEKPSLFPLGLRPDEIG